MAKTYPLAGRGDANVTGPVPKALAGVATVDAATVGAATGLAVCGTCGLNLPRNAAAVDVVAHVCYRGFTIGLTAAGHLNLT